MLTHCSPYGSTTGAYTRAEDPDDGYPMINFCPAFFDRRSLTDAITYGRDLQRPDNLNLGQYENRANMFFVSGYKAFEQLFDLLTNRQHELCHIALAANTPPNPEINDIVIKYRYGNQGVLITQVANGLIMTKILARYPGGPYTTGYWVQRNADSFTRFVLAKYVQRQLGNVYPHLPVVFSAATDVSNPFPPSPYIVEFVTEGGEFYLNNTDKISTTLDTERGCSDDQSINGAADPSVSIDSFAPTSAYPDEYNRQVSSWIAALPTASSATSPATTTTTLPSSRILNSSSSPSASFTPGTCSFHLRETETCAPVYSNLFAIITLYDGARASIGNTSVPSGSPGVSINDGAGYVFSTSALPYPLVVTGEHKNDYVQFTYGSLSWTSRKPRGVGVVRWAVGNREMDRSVRAEVGRDSRSIIWIVPFHVESTVRIRGHDRFLIG